MRILGLDPGTRVAGYGIIDAEGSRLRFVTAGVLRAPAAWTMEKRLAKIARELRTLLVEQRPQVAALEDVFVKTDPRAALAIGQGRGAMLAVLGEADLSVTSYPPASVKRAVAGNGRADKGQVARMVGILLGLATLPSPADATDALALAIAHAAARRTQDIIGQ